ncbi:MAG: hypothetical protein JW990_20585 [Thermoleophilia bacterium]|nr:hypothetical protein [Thermoleophilia bacterium]
MQVVYKGQRVFLLVAALLVVGSGLLTGACADDEAPPDTTAASAVTSTTAGGATATTAPVAESPTSSTAGATTTTTSATTTTVASATTTNQPTTTTTTAGATTTTAKATTTTAKTTTTTAKPTTTTAKAPTVLKVSGPSGVKELSMADLKTLPATSGYGGWINQLSNITAPASWKGVSLTTLLELVGGGGGVTVVASDGYTAALSAGQARGDVPTYDPSTGDPVSGISVKAIVAYAKEGRALGSGEGPLRIAFVSSDGNQVADSDMWVKYVVEIRAD